MRHHTIIRPVLDSNGNQISFEQVEIPFTAEEENAADLREVAYAIQKDAAQADAVRTDRNKRLADCDWTQVADASVDKAAWAAYRQALRDVSTQAGFPWEVTWPDQP